MRQDLRFAARLLWKSPLFSAGVIALLALGVAANTVVFSLVDALLLRPLPVRDSERLVRIVTIREPLGVRGYFEYREYEAWKQRASALEDLFAWSDQDMYVTVNKRAERAKVHFVTEEFFPALGATAVVGQLFEPGTKSRSTEIIPTVLSHSYWKRRFNGDPHVVGRSIEVDGRAVVIVGVTAKGFNGMSVETSPDLRIPAAWLRTLRPNAEAYWEPWEVVGRLRADQSHEAARQQSEAIWAAKWREFNPTDPGLPGRFDLEPASRGISAMRAKFTGVLWVLMGGVALLMLMVCANVAGLLLARSAGRRGELAVRLAMGATRLRLARQLFCESLLLMTGGVVGAAALSFIAIPLVADALPLMRDLTATRLSLALDLAPDWRVLTFTGAISALTVLLFGLVPALTSARRDLHPLLKEARSGSAHGGRQALVSAQVALCTLLLVGTGLTVTTLRNLEGMNPGFTRDRVVTFGVDPEMAKYTPEQAKVLKQRLLDTARETPGVVSAAFASRGLMRGTGFKSTVLRAGERATQKDFLNTSTNGVGREYFETMGIPLLEGRNFTGHERGDVQPRPVIVNESFARRIGAGRGVLGNVFGGAQVNGAPAKPDWEVIGIVADTKYRSLREPFHPIMYTSSMDVAATLHVRTRADADSTIAAMNEALAKLDPRLSYVEVTTLQDEVQASLWAERVAAFLTTLFSIAAALIAGAGLYALVAFTIAQRKREIGIRVALGATQGNVVSLMFVRAACLALVGVAVGLLGAWILSPKIAPILYNMEPHDWTVLSAAAACAFAVTAIAALIPSLHASRVHPASVLREE